MTPDEVSEFVRSLRASFTALEAPNSNILPPQHLTYPGRTCQCLPLPQSREQQSEAAWRWPLHATSALLVMRHYSSLRSSPRSVIGGAAKIGLPETGLAIIPG